MVAEHLQIEPVELLQSVYHGAVQLGEVVADPGRLALLAAAARAPHPALIAVGKVVQQCRDTLCRGRQPSPPAPVTLASLPTLAWSAAKFSILPVNSDREAVAGTRSLKSG